MPSQSSSTTVVRYDEPIAQGHAWLCDHMLNGQAKTRQEQQQQEQQQQQQLRSSPQTDAPACRPWGGHDLPALQHDVHAMMLRATLGPSVALAARGHAALLASLLPPAELAGAVFASNLAQARFWSPRWAALAVAVQRECAAAAAATRVRVVVSRKPALLQLPARLSAAELATQRALKHEAAPQPLLLLHRAHAKKRRQDPERAHRGNPALRLPGFRYEARQAGQDRVISMVGIGSHAQNRLLGCFDGHGAEGHHVAYLGCQLLVAEVLRALPIVEMHLRTECGGGAAMAAMAEVRARELIAPLLAWCYRTAERKLVGEHPEFAHHSGTTVAVALVLRGAGGERHLVSSNAGDSQVLWYPSAGGAVQECSREHNCDNVEAVSDYLAHLHSYRRQLAASHRGTKAELLEQLGVLWPRPVYYSRINTDGGMPVDAITDKQGRPCPLPVYNYVGTTAEINDDSYERLSEIWPCGQQSRRYPETHIREDGRRVVRDPEQRPHNWGSSLDGDGQNLRGLGDTCYGEHTPCVPFVSVRAIPEQGTLGLCSDGLSDLFWFDEWMAFLDGIRDEPSQLRKVYSHLARTAEGDQHGNYRSEQVCGMWFPKWDDLSGVACFLSATGDG
jgi:serine/threonine protein phosphatase PrpC